MSVVGGVREAIARFKHQMEQTDVPVVITGGESSSVADELRSAGVSVVHQPHIVTEGILILLSKATIENLHDSIIGKITT
jgi:pantothenate kinase type III